MGPAASDKIPPGARPVRQVPVWDLGVRLFHWSLVACVLADFALLEEGGLAHRWVGYGATALVLWRVVWGFVGGRYARFSGFVPTPGRLREHLLAHLPRGGEPLRHAHPEDDGLGHNPLGALMMLTLMACVLGLGLTGWMQGLDPFFGEEWLEELHEGLANTLVALAGVHALAAVLVGRLEGRNLVWSMVTGRKTVGDGRRAR